MGKDRWWVPGEYGGSFTNLKDAKRCAREASRVNEDRASTVWRIQDGFWYIEYTNGRLTYDGWTIKKGG